MSTQAIASAKAVRNTRKIDRPRPLRQDSKRPPSVGDDLITDVDNVHKNLNKCNFNQTLFEQLQQVCNTLKLYGAQLETRYKDELDHYFVSFRNASRDDRLDRISRLRLLEVIELRAMGWKQNENISKYYQNKLVQLENILERGPTPVTSASTSSIEHSTSFSSLPFSLTPGEILKASGKFSKATKIPGKNYFKDEIVIRNSDSGKVAQGVKQRLVQITGPHEQAIGCAKGLIEDTIRRNASPVREDHAGIVKSVSNQSIESNGSDDSGTSQDCHFKVSPISHSFSVNDASTIRDYQYTVMVHSHPIRICGPNLDKVRTAKLVLEEYFSGPSAVDSSGYSSCNHSMTDMGKGRRPQSMHVSSTLGLIPLQRSKSIPLHGHSSSDEDQTLYDSVEVKRGDTPNQDDSLHSASFRRNRFASRSSPISSGDSDHANYNDTRTLECSPFRISYTRNFLLECAKSPFSTLVPKDLTKIVQDLPYLFKKTAAMFDPDEYRRQELLFSASCV